MSPVRVRYIVHDVTKALDFYMCLFGFEVQMQPAPGFARLHHETGFDLLLNEPHAGGAGQSLPGGATPEPGGWNRIQLSMRDLPERVADLEAAGVHVRSDIITGKGGRQALIADPSGNLIELFESYRR